MSTPHPQQTPLTRLRTPPHSIEAEQSVLGGLLLDQHAWDRIAGSVDERDFYRPAHRLLFATMRDLAEDTKPLDVVTVWEAVQTKGHTEKTGGAAYLAELAESTPAAANIRAYADIVREHSTLRQLLSAVNDIAANVWAPEGRSSAELLSEAERIVFDISEGRISGEGPRHLTTLLGPLAVRIEELAKSGGGITGLATGFSDLDELTSGLQDSDLVVIAGRPAMGKTSLALNIAQHAVMVDAEDTRPVVLFSMEQPCEQIALRLLSSLAPIDHERLRRGRLEEGDWPLLASALGQLRGRPLYIDDTPALTPTDLRARVRRVMREAGPVKMVIADYMQLMRAPGRQENRTLEISEISRSLKAVAKEMHCPLVALSQLNRSLESRENKRPRMSDLRESGAIEQDADLILFIYRDEVYNAASEDKGVAEIIIGKQRNGPVGTVRLAFLGHLTKFEPYIEGDRYPDGPER